MTKAQVAAKRAELRKRRNELNLELDAINAALAKLEDERWAGLEAELAEETAEP